MPETPIIPGYVKNRAPEIQKKWTFIYESVFEKNGKEMALIVANKWLQGQVVEKKVMARTDACLESVSFVVEDTEFLTRTEDGEDYVSFKLADNAKDKFGVQLPDSILQAWAEKINSGEIVLGDIDHKAFEQLLNSGASDEQIKSQIKQKPSIAKAVKAVFEKGRLWVRAIIDKRYKKTIEKSKGVSLEAAVKRDLAGNVITGDLLGFTFGINQNPVIPGTEVYV